MWGEGGEDAVPVSRGSADSNIPWRYDLGIVGHTWVSGPRVPELLLPATPLPSPKPTKSACVLSQFNLVLRSVTPWTVAHQAPLSMAFSRQEYWSGLPCPPPGDLPDPGIKPMSPVSPALAGGFFTTGATWEGQLNQQWF